MRQIKLLTLLELRNLYGINVIRHIKDPAQKKKTWVFIGIIVFLLVVVLSYIVALCAGLGILGASDLIPAYLIAISSFLILFFDVFKTGGVIFRKNGYDIMTAFPLTLGAVVVSRFLRMYVETLLVETLIFVPGFVVYAVFERPEAASYLLALLVMLATPTLPLAVSVLVGVLITALASRMKHKSIAEAASALVVVVGVLLLSFKLGGTEEEFTLEMLSRFSEAATDAIRKFYPPALLLGNAIAEKNPIPVLLFGAGSLFVTLGVVWLVKINYHTIFQNLYTVMAKHNYKLGELKTNTVKKAILLREARRYFSSGPYVSNTIIGPAMGAVMGVALLFVDLDTALSSAASGMPIAMNLKGALPLLLAAVMAMMNAVCISVSMEGKEWWILKTLPLATKTILNAKLLFNLLLIAPFFAVAQVCCVIAWKPKFAEAVLAVVLAMLLSVFSCVFGLWINLLFPKLDWENETVAVKQSAASFLGGIGGVFVTLLFVIPVVFLPQTYYSLVCLIEIILLSIVTRAIYTKITRVNLAKIQ